MCEYIKDDGEQCGMDNHDGVFCHMHEDSEQAEQWRDQKREDYGAVGGSQGADAAPDAIVMDETCDECDAALRRTERLTDHENLGGQMMFVALVECDCGECVLGTQPVRVNELPGGWL